MRIVIVRDPAYEIQAKVLGTPLGGGEFGTCRGESLRTEACAAFCADPESSRNRRCERPLLEHCKSQITPETHEAFCSCWLSDEAYGRITRKKMSQIGIDVDSQAGRGLADSIRLDSPFYAEWLSREPTTCSTPSLLVCLLSSIPESSVVRISELSREPIFYLHANHVTK